MNRRQFLRVGALFVPAAAAPRVAYSFLWTPAVRLVPAQFFPVAGVLMPFVTACYLRGIVDEQERTVFAKQLGLLR